MIRDPLKLTRTEPRLKRSQRNELGELNRTMSTSHDTILALVPTTRGVVERAFRSVAVFALRRSGRGYLDAFQSAVGATRFFQDTPTDNVLFVELADAVTEMPAIAHLAVRGALADPSPDVVRAGRSVLQIYPDLGSMT
jgi:hypothetical protein